MAEEIDRNAVLIVDALFRLTAAKTAAAEGVSVEDALEAVWTLFEAGFLHLVAGSDDEHPLGIEPYGFDRAERRAMAKQNKRLVQARRAPPPEDPS
jgi:hypothetical protein